MISKECDLFKMKDLNIYSMVLGPVQTNTYLAVNPGTNECLIVDPAQDADRIIGQIDKLQAVPAAVLLTHGHADHILAVNDLKEHYNIPVLCCRDEDALLRDPWMNLSTGMPGMSDYRVAADTLLADEQELTLAGVRIKALATPGHTAGGMCYYLPDEEVLFSGDTLFWRSVGRSDLPTGDEETLLISIRKKLLPLPDGTAVLPGHGPASTIGAERRQNPFI